MKPRTFAAAITAFLCSALLAADLRAQFDMLVQYVPNSANAIVLMNVQRLFASPLSQREGWQGNREQRFAAGLTSIPPSADHVVIATQFDLGSMHRAWEVGVVQSDSPPLLSTVAREMGGVLDRVSGVPAVRLADNTFVVELSQHLRAAMAPGNRQQVARWISQSNGQLSPYLKEAVGFADKQAEVIMALDLTDAITADEIAHRMGANMDVYQDVLKQSPMEPKQLAELLASIKGVTLGITFRDHAYGKIKVDFGQDASQLAPIAKPLLLAVIAHRGAMVDDFNDWTSEVAGNQVTLGGNLTSSGVMRLSSLVELPTHAMHGPTWTTASKDAPANDANANAAPKSMLQATQDYFQGTQRLMRDLKQDKRDAHSYGSIGMWYDNYARKIERLPILNVDPEMLNYGTYLAGNLRNASMAIKGAGIRTRPEEMAASAATGGGSFGASYGYGYGGFYASGSSADYIMARAAGNSPEMAAFNTAKAEVRQAQAARLQVRANEKAKAATSVTGLMAQIDDATAKVRRDMTQKYQVEF